LSETSGDIATAGRPVVVLDTNTVLDWLVFRDPVVRSLMTRLEAGDVHWLACPSMREELAHTLGYRKLEKWSPDPQSALQAYDALVTPVAEPPRSVGSMRCTDPDDQVFIDLALAQRARWLISKDRAVLKLARRARAWGLAILPPKDWSPD
jgi:putative PIN family toxin of toxin-antitoxin system